MVDLINTGNAQPPGTFVTNANSGGIAGQAFSNVVVAGAANPAGGAAGVQFSGGASALGRPVTIRIAPVSGGGSYLRHDSVQTGTRFVIEREFVVPATVGARYTMMDLRVGSTPSAAYIIDTDRKPIMAHGSGNTEVAASKPALALTPGSLVQVKLAVTPGAAGAGIVEVAIYTDDGATLIHSYTYSAASPGTASPTQYRFGDSTGKTSFPYDYVGVTACGPRTAGWINAAYPPETSSPAKRWNVATSSYVDLDSRRWDGTQYVPIDISGGL